MRRIILCACAAIAVAGCGARSTKLNATKTDAGQASPLASSTTIGRVVVYRNGVAYFERHAHVMGDTLVLTVPAAKVDDMLKSLTVVDMKSKQPAPVSYRTDVAPGKDAMVEMTIALTGPAPHDLLLSYVAEAPAWKPSYRVTMGDDGEIDVQGWTVIDNASGEDWTGVKIGVSSSSALSFRTDLRSIRDVPRDTLAPSAPFATQPHLVDIVDEATAEPPPAAPARPAAPPPKPSTEPIGTSSFESPIPMTVKRGTSTMISILHERTQGEFAYLYDPTSTRPDAQFPYRVVRLKNPTDSVLESGPVALFGGGRFIGEGMPEPIAARAVAFIPYALDRQVVVERRPATSRESIGKILSVDHGIIQVEMRHAMKTTFALRNRQNERAVVYMRHNVTRGYHLVTSASERIGDSQMFRVVVDPTSQIDFAIEEELPVARALDVRAAGALDLVQAYLNANPGEDPLRTRVASLVATEKRVHEDEAHLATLQREIAAYAERSAELKAQIAELKAAKAGAPLQKELGKMLAEIDRNQSKAIAESAALKDGLTVQRIAFQNAAASLTVAVTDRTATAQHSGG